MGPRHIKLSRLYFKLCENIPYCLFFFSGIILEGKKLPRDLNLEDDPNYLEERDPLLPPIRTIEVQCFPLYSILMAMGNPHVDYFSLDIEGAEMVVLETIPWNKVNMTLVSVEVNHAGEIFPGTREDIFDLMTRNGFRYSGTATIDDIFYNQTNDRFLKKKKKSLKKKSEL